MRGGENPPKLVIANQTASASGGLFDCRLLDRSQDRAALLGRDRNAKFLAFQVDAIEPAFLTENDSTLCVHKFRRVGLDCLRKMKLSGYCTAFAHE